jgi:hypothetical protein
MFSLNHLAEFAVDLRHKTIEHSIRVINNLKAKAARDDILIGSLLKIALAKRIIHPVLFGLT